MACLQEDCANWDGHGCPCAVLDLKPVDVRVFDDWGTLDEPDYVDCTCGHPNDDHNLGECPFLGCGCGVLDSTTSPADPKEVSDG